MEGERERIWKRRGVSRADREGAVSGADHCPVTPTRAQKGSGGEEEADRRDINRERVREGEVMTAQ